MRAPLHVTCCIAGGGPAGMMLGLLLARAGVRVAVLEKHADFLRDFRGDTIHPSTLEIVKELGLLDDFLSRPHEKVERIRVQVGQDEFTLADFTHLPVSCPFVAMMPQWDFLDFLSDHARPYPHFSLHMQTRATGLIEENGRVAGLTAESPDGPLEIRADLTVCADGRHSILRDAARLPRVNLGAPIDVLWMRISRIPSDPVQPVARFERGRIFVMIYRGSYWQCALVIPKGGAGAIHAEGIERFRARIHDSAPWLGERPQELKSFDDVKLLTVTVDRLTRWWKPGLLAIGDAAHAMSPVGGVGINLAIQDAVAAANILAQPLTDGTLSDAQLAGVQKRREFPTRVTQRMQLLVQDNILNRVITGSGELSPPLIARIIARLPFLARIPARLMGVGVRPEHIR